MRQPMPNGWRPAAAPLRRPDQAPSGGRLGASLLLWALLLVAIVATAWYFQGGQHPRDLASVPVVGKPASDATDTPSPLPAPGDVPLRERRPAARPDRDAFASSHPTPAYPGVAQRAGNQGVVLLQVDVGADGLPVAVEVARSSGSRELDHAAIEAVQAWAFEPAVRDGKPAASRVQVPVEFRLDNI